MNSSINITRGVKRYELTNHLGNVNVVLTDKRVQVCNADTVTYYTADVVSANDYSPFGAPLAGRTYTAPNSEYRFHFNGKENDNEVKGQGNSIDFGERIYDSRLCKWLAVDMAAKEAPSWSPYRFGFNNPLRFVDPNGAFEIDKKTAEKYPALNTLLKTISEVYSQKPAEFRAAFKEYGQLTDEQVSKMLEYKLVENGTPVTENQETPRIVVTKLNKYEIGSTPFRSFKREEDGSLASQTTGIIKLNKSFVKEFEKETKKNKALKKDVQKEVMTRTLFHEGTHYGDFSDGTADKTSRDEFLNTDGTLRIEIGASREGGDDFEKKAYGYSSSSMTKKQYLRAVEKDVKNEMR